MNLKGGCARFKEAHLSCNLLIYIRNESRYFCYYITGFGSDFWVTWKAEKCYFFLQTFNMFF